MPSRLLSCIFFLLIASMVKAQEVYQPITSQNIQNLVQIDTYSNIHGYVTTISHDDSLLVTQTNETIMVWQLSDEELVFELPFHTYEWSTVEFSPDDSKIAIARGSLYVIDTESWEISLFRDGSIHDVAFSPDGSIIASAKGLQDCGSPYSPTHTYINTIRLQDANTGQLLAELYHEDANFGGFLGVTFNPDGSLLAGLGTGALFLWDLEMVLDNNVAPIAQTWVLQQGGDVRFSSDGNHIVVSYTGLISNCTDVPELVYSISATLYSTEELVNAGITEWDGNSTLGDEFIGFYTFGARIIMFNHSDDLLLIFGEGTATSVWNVENREQVLIFEGDASLILTSDNEFLITSGDENGVRVWGVEASS